MRSLYLDVYFFLNLLADYLICLSAARLCSVRLRRKRYLAAALLGALFALLPILPGFDCLASPWAIFAAALAMGLIAFGNEQQLLRCILAMLLVSSAFGGALYALTLSIGAPVRLSFSRLLAIFLFCYGILKLLSRFHSRWDGSSKAEIRLRFLGREASFSALIDSGNSVRCPRTGEAVLIASPRALRPLFAEYSVCLEELQPVDLLQALSEVPAFAGKMRLIPFHSIGGSGLLPVFRPESLWINGRKEDGLLVAVSREVSGCGFEAIL